MVVLDMSGAIADQINRGLERHAQRLESENQILRRNLCALEQAHADLQRAFLELGRQQFVEASGPSFVSELHALGLYDVAVAGDRRPS